MARTSIPLSRLERPREVFIDCAKNSSDAAYQAEAAAIFASFALRYGCPLDKLVTAAPRLENGAFAEPVGHFLSLVQKGEVL